MSQDLWEVVRDILNTFSVKCSNETLEDLSCAICKGIMIDANQLMCGCKFCRQCIEKYFEDGGRHCPINDNGLCSVNFNSMDDLHCELECNQAILALTVNCPTQNCYMESSVKQMVPHWLECRPKNSKRVSENEMHSNIINISSVVSNDKSSKEIKKANYNADTMEDLQIQISALKRKNKKLEKTVEEMNKRVNCLERDKAKSEHTLDVMFEALQSLEERLEEEKHDPFVWVIENFAQLRKNKDSLSSESFFVLKNGYKMRLIMYPQSPYDENYVSLYFELVRGEYDSLLEWPFRYNVTFTVVAQNGGTDHTFTVFYLHHKGREYAYRRPLSNHNVPLGASEFLEYSFCLEGSLVKDDVMVLICSFTKSPSGYALEC